MVPAMVGERRERMLGEPVADVLPRQIGMTQVGLGAIRHPGEEGVYQDLSDKFRVQVRLFGEVVEGDLLPLTRRRQVCPDVSRRNCRCTLRLL